MKFVILGGGIAGFCCAEELCRLRTEDSVTLVSATSTLKGVSNVQRLSKIIEEFQVERKDLKALPFPNLDFRVAEAVHLDTEQKYLELSDGDRVAYDRLCLCCGATPKLVANSPHVLVLRDEDTVAALSGRLATARRIVLVGNGGIALELANALQGVEVVWVVKHDFIGDSFFDADAAAFLQSALALERADSGRLEAQERRQHDAHRMDGCSTSYAVMQGHKPVKFGHAVGPQWMLGLPSGPGSSRLDLQYGAEVDLVTEKREEVGGAADLDDWPVYVRLTNGATYGADFIVSAIGVQPSTAWLPPELDRAEDGGLLVDRDMRTSAEEVFAAGDVATLQWPDMSPTFYQRRLWTQARLMGRHAAHCMAGSTDDLATAFAFELFTHVTRFLGKKVVLLGLYNGQGLSDEDEPHIKLYSRYTEGPAAMFVRVLLLRGRMMGAVLIGETGLEDTFENLILDGLDLSPFGPELLDPDIELDAIFD